MKKAIIAICIALTILGCTRKKELADTEGATVFGSEAEVFPKIEAPCTLEKDQFMIKGKTYTFTRVDEGYGYPEFSIYAEDLWSDFSITLSKSPVQIPDTIRIDGKTKNSIYIKSLMLHDENSAFDDYEPDYSNITEPVYLYINKEGNYTTYQICDLPVVSDNYYKKTSTFSTKLYIKN